MLKTGAGGEAFPPTACGSPLLTRSTEPKGERPPPPDWPERPVEAPQRSFAQRSQPTAGLRAGRVRHAPTVLGTVSSRAPQHASLLWTAMRSASGWSANLPQGCGQRVGDHRNWRWATIQSLSASNASRLPRSANPTHGSSPRTANSRVWTRSTSMMRIASSTTASWLYVAS